MYIYTVNVGRGFLGFRGKVQGLGKNSLTHLFNQSVIMKALNLKGRVK